MKAMLLCAGKGVRFRPVTEAIPKPLFPFLNVPLARVHLLRLRDAGVAEVGINLHHLGHQIEGNLRDGRSDLPELRFFREPQILGTAGALRNAADWLAGEDFFLVNADAAIEPDFGRLLSHHRESGRAATLLLAENREPDRLTPLETDGDRIKAFGRMSRRPLLYTGVAVLSRRLLRRIPPGETSLVTHLWQPLLEEGKEEIGLLLHEGPFSDLGRPSDFLRATLEALDRRGPFPPGSGAFHPESRLLSLVPFGHFQAHKTVLGRISVGSGTRIRESAIWDGVEIGESAQIENCLVAGGRVPARAVFKDALLWRGQDGTTVSFPLK